MSFCHNARFRRWTLAITALVISCAAIAPAQNPAKDSSSAAPAIWHDPGDIKSKDLLNGPGGEKHHPQLPVKFLKEDKHGQNSKFDVEDANGTKWKAKLGIEAQPEVVATRLLWAIGYFTNENYFIPNLEVKELPDHLHRGQGHVISPGHLDGARLQRHRGKEKKEANWNWRHNPFVGTREFNGLRVMMALLSNWDLKDGNNAIFTDKEGQQQYLVTDVGTAFGASGTRYTEAGSKNNLKAYRESKFVGKVMPTYVDFNFPRYPPPIHIIDPPHYFHLVHMRWVGNRVPRADAKWLGSLLAQLTTDQILDAFRAGGYPPDKAAAFTKVVQSRIAELNQL
ncbi:MAG TPA: hypothetical protein VGJ30_14500 [Candidatus Angelobacter sp.]